MNKDALYGLVITVAIGLAGFSLKWTFQTNAQIALMQEQLRLVREDHAKDLEQDKQIHAFWKYCAWLHWQVNQIRHKEGLEPTQNPNLD